jgi:hypothetical protein
MLHLGVNLLRLGDAAGPALLGLWNKKSLSERDPVVMLPDAVKHHA